MNMKRRLTGFVCAACLLLTGCTTAQDTSAPSAVTESPSLQVTGEMSLSYADQFSVKYCEGGYAIIEIRDGQRFLLVPEGKDVPADVQDMTVLRQPLEQIYVAASSAVDLFDGIGALDSVKMTSTKDWSLPAVQDALASGKMQYVGKYSAPDYEQLLSANCGLAIESTMIYHTPETKEQLESLGIPVLVERSSYESHPLGRMEWLRLYGLLLGRQAEADAYFAQQSEKFQKVASLSTDAEQRPTVAFFYISPNGYVNVRKPGDYISAMIDLAGGTYCLTAEDLDVEENALSTMNIQMESFYALAKDADILIYNATINGELTDLDQMLGMDSMLADFKAVKEGKVWCTEQDMFQQTTGGADMICDLYSIFHEDGEDLTFLHRLQ